MNFFYQIISALVGYCLAAMFSSSVAMVPALTLWGSIWTYFVLAFWWFVALWITWLIPVVIVGGGALAFVGVVAGAIGLAEWLDKRR